MTETDLAWFVIAAIVWLGPFVDGTLEVRECELR